MPGKGSAGSPDMALRLLVTGRDGQIAKALARAASGEVEIVCAGRPELDVTDAASIRAAIARHRPDIVINPAAYTAVDKAESEPEIAFSVNRDGAGNVAKEAAEAGLAVVHLSTDYVFSGEGSAPYVETDAPGPVGVYGGSKLAGEAAVARANDRHVILRTSWVYAPWGNNFARTMLRLAENRDVVRVVADQSGAPSYAPDIAVGILAVCNLTAGRPSQTNLHGVFHMTNGGETSWAGFAEEVFARSREEGGAFAAVEPIATAQYPTPAKRPANSRLDNHRFNTTFGHVLPHWRDGVRRFAHAIQEG